MEKEILTATFLALVTNRLVEAFFTPLFDRFKWDKFVLIYVSWVIASILVGISGVNLFSEYIPNSPLLGQILTAILAGGGSNLIHDLFDKKPS